MNLAKYDRYDEISKNPEPPPEIRDLDFTWVSGSHWLNPRKSCNPNEDEMRHRCWHHLAEFIREYKVHPFKVSPYNLMKFLASGGASREQTNPVAVQYFDRSGYHWNTAGLGSVFDHVEFWGRDKTPFFMIGHPYTHIHLEGMATLSALLGLGLGVEISVPGLSWYGFGTLHVRVGRLTTVHDWTASPCGRGEGDGQINASLSDL
jgi:hypothetical protein